MPTVGINGRGHSTDQIWHQPVGEWTLPAAPDESVPTRLGGYRPAMSNDVVGGAPWVMRMRWVDLLFAHWPMSVEALRPLVPAMLEIETFEGQAWLGIVPFRMEDVAPRFLPAPPLAGRFHELNVRTYVRHRGRSGVWFLSLDAASRVAVEGARLGFHLPYFHARMSAQRVGGWTEYRSERTDARGREAVLDGRYRAIGPAAVAAPGTLDAWLTERRALFAVDGNRDVLLGKIRHPRWPLQPAEAEFRVNTMAAAHGLELPAVPPLLHFARKVEVQGWWPRRVG
jgi:uncharacterized protein YqjF (DUF2071 family)